MPADPLEDHIAATAATLGLTVRPEWQASVRANLDVSLKMARLVQEFPLPDEIEPANIYEA